VDASGQWNALSGEGGHVTLAATDDLEVALLDLLRKRFGHASAERVLSGPGLVNLYEALSAVRGAAAQFTLPQDIVNAAREGSDAMAIETAGLFCGFLGNVAGNLALTLGARGGLYVGGGITPKLGPAFDAKRFRSQFETKGRFASYLSEIPTWLITAANPSLTGAARALDFASR